ncbi:hypothetical protein IEQ34_001727 [Dendrobium chrysotoxum]|uniref:Uncharacterized protein n=1 Tax=Dendrobium chrysotoxum TaxID=161865 RepID=A0AAV7HPG0_DENCH|nr:hypothetical protein IEQ34_001727 [Dendrobium chrysotoxum]
MSTQKHSSFFFLLLIQAFLFPFINTNASSTAGDFNNVGLKRFIVSVRRPEDVKQEQSKQWYESLLAPLTTVVSKAGGEGGVEIPRLLHSYSDVLSGFSARLTENELDDMSKMDWYVNAIPDPVYKLHTTHSPEFLGLIQPAGGGLLNASKQGEGIIIGLLDTGITADHPSFSDHGLPPPPPKWKGRCNYGKPLCNNKLIGARSFITGEPDKALPVDQEGHGTHTASTAAGAAVSNASAFGNAAGTAVGMAARAHIAAYKVCSDDLCFGSDILAGMEAAIEDGVDVLSISLGGGSPLYFYEDPMAISTFTAMSKGIFISASAGNDGPGKETVVNDAPWVLTVAASTMDRRIVADVMLGNGKVLKGESLNQTKDFPAKNMLPLVFPGGNGDEITAACDEGSLAGFDVRGKVVVCQRGINGRVMKGSVVKEAGGAAMILINTEIGGYTTFAEPHVLPASHVSHEDGLKILEYINSTRTPTASIAFGGTELKTPFSPSIADFSSRGPSKVSPGILKPDITGPGVSVLAAWPELEPATQNPSFNIISGTSMSCPHLSGIAALIKAAHPNWSPAAVKSAMLTTADVVDHGGNPISNEKRKPADHYALGAGHVNPEKALNPGLVYNLKKEDYISYFCGLGYSESMISVIVKQEVNCSKVGSIKEAELNYPSFSAELRVGETLILRRVLTNVGEECQNYRADIDEPEGVMVTVKPNNLTFHKVNDQKEFSIILKRSKKRLKMAKGYLKWVSENHLVRSPILISFKQ